MHTVKTIFSSNYIIFFIFFHVKIQTRNNTETVQFIDVHGGMKTTEWFESLYFDSIHFIQTLAEQQSTIHFYIVMVLFDIRGVVQR